MPLVDEDYKTLHQMMSIFLLVRLYYHYGASEQYQGHREGDDCDYCFHDDNVLHICTDKKYTHFNIKMDSQIFKLC